MFAAMDTACGSHQILCQRGDSFIFQAAQFTPVAIRLADEKYRGLGRATNGRASGSSSRKFGSDDSVFNISVHDAAYTPALRTEYGFIRAPRIGFLGFQRGRSGVVSGLATRTPESLFSVETTVFDCASTTGVRPAAKSPTANTKIRPEVRRVIPTLKA